MSIGYAQFDIAKRRIQGLLDRVSSVITESAFQQRLQAARDRLDHEKMNLLVVGEFSRGKSTFINALLSAPVLPSTVDETTATINVITGGTDRKMTVRRRDGSIEELDLPADKVNKLLERYVTVENKSASEIAEVLIEWPGLLEKLDCCIVDTPGVQSLDALREEITYNYLSRADACVFLLDSQQPLAHTERQFLKDKILKSDVQRLFFVINRMDDNRKDGVLSTLGVDRLRAAEPEPDVVLMKRLQSYVEKKLHEYVPELRAPVICPVASKPALKARYKGSPSLWEPIFAEMEQKLFAFVSDNATRFRLPDHFNRVVGIARDGLATLRERRALLDLSGEEVKHQLAKFDAEERRLTTVVSLINTLLEQEKATLTNRLRTSLSDTVTRLRVELLSMAENCSSDEDIAALRSRVAVGSRTIEESTRDILDNFNEQVRGRLVEHFAALYPASKSVQLGFASSQLSAVASSSLPSFDSFRNKKSGETDWGSVGTSMVVGGAMGYIGAAFWGPIGLVAAVIGSIFLGKKMDEESSKRDWDRIRRETVANIKHQMDGILAECERGSLRVAEEHANRFHERIVERVNARLESLRSTIATQRSATSKENQNLTVNKEELDNSIQALEALVDEAQRLEKEFV